MKTLVVIPTFNEADNIEGMIRSVFAVIPSSGELHILVVDDNSPDHTARVVKNLMLKPFPKTLFLLSREAKQGLGTAYIEGFQWGLSRGYDLFVEMDADFSHNPKYLPAMIEQAHKYDVVIGSRYIAEGGVKGWGWLRRCISMAGSLYARLILCLPIHDFTGGFNLWKRAVLTHLDLNHIRSEGYAFQIELKYKAVSSGFSYVEYPILFEDRRAGTSKMSKRIIVEAIVRVIQMKRYGNRHTRPSM